MTRLQGLVLWALALIERYRFLKFVTVGLSGLVVNLAVLYICHNYVFYALEAVGKRPYFSQAVAIVLSTINNFCWNRLWTWSDRVRTFEAEEGATAVQWRVVLVEFRQYATATGFGSGLQYVIAQLLAGMMNYMLATILAIVAASVTNFLANDRWTFKHRKD